MKRLLRAIVSTICYLFSFLKKREGIIVLMYHRVNDALKPNDLVVPTEVFRAQMRYLKDNCEVVSMGSLLDSFKVSTNQGANKLKRQKVVITFDDGYRDNYTNAFPILKELGLPATIFLITGMIGTDLKRPRYRGMPYRDMMDWAEVREMSENGITFGAHTVTHPHLSQLDQQAQKVEIGGSREALGLNVSRSQGIKVFCYPYGDYNGDTLKVLKELGIEIAFTVKPGINTGKTPLLELRRTEISGLDSMFDFRKKLAGAFDFLHLCVQNIGKK